MAQEYIAERVYLFLAWLNLLMDFENRGAIFFRPGKARMGSARGIPPSEKR
jgi:hypothetical protein